MSDETSARESSNEPRTATLTLPSERELRVERTFDAPRERVWRALTDPLLVAQWWGRGNKLVVEKMELRRGGHWRFVEQAPSGEHGFEGRYREVTPPERISMTFEWDGKPGFVAVETMTLEDLGDGRTKLVTTTLFHTGDERDGMVGSGMEAGMNESYRALDRLLEAMAAEGWTPPASLEVRKVAFTMYPVTDVARARAFYEGTLGLAVGMSGSQGDHHWIEYDLPGGGCLALTNTTGDEPSAAAGGTLALEVADLASLLTHLRAEGVEIKSGVIRGPRCQMAVCVDSEGNSLVLHQLDRVPAA